MTYVGETELKKTIAEHTEPGFSVERFYAQCFLDMLTENHLDLKEKNLNNLCPDVHPMGVEEFLNTWWNKA